MYAIKHKVTGEFFHGFNGLETVWSGERKAKRMEFLVAKAQAALFVRHAIDVQRKPVIV